MNKKLIIGLTAAGVLALSGITYASATNDTCGYDPVTGYYHEGGKVYAYGPWDKAMECAIAGMLPDIKYTYKGLFGGTHKDILETDTVAKQAKKAAEEKAKAEGNK